MADIQSLPEEPNDKEEAVRPLSRRGLGRDQADNLDTDHGTELEEENSEKRDKEEDTPDALANGFPASPSVPPFPKSSLEDITEENEGAQYVTEKDENGHQSPYGPAEHSSPYASRRQSAKPKSRTGMGSRGRWVNDVPASSESYPNTDSTIYSPGGRSVEFESPDHWNAPIGSPIRSQWSSPIASPIGDRQWEQRSKSRVQVKDHGPVAKWLAKRSKKSQSAPEKSTKSLAKAKKSGRVRSQYAPYIQPKVISHNPDYQPAELEPHPILSEKLKWEAKSVVNTHNEYFRQSSEKKSFRVLNEKLQWDPATKVDVWNRDYTPNVAKPFKVFSEKLKWNQPSKVDNQGEAYPTSVSHADIFNEPPNWRSHAKIETYNKNYVKPQKGDSTVFHETPQWKAQSKVDNLKPFYKPSGGGNLRVKTDRLNWKSESKVDTSNPMYQSTKSSPQPNKNKGLWNTTAKVENGHGTKDNNGWSSHSSDTETEWLSMSPGGSEKLSPKPRRNVTDRSKSQQNVSSYSPSDFNWSQRKVLFNSRDLIDEDGLATTRSYPFYNSKPTPSHLNVNDQQQQKKKKPVYTTHKPEVHRDQSKPEKQPKRLFKERTDPLPPIGTYTHKVDEPVVYPENGTYYGQPNRGNKPSTQKIEVIDMKDLTLLSKRGIRSVYIN